MVESITSPANPLLKEIRRAVSRGELTRQGWAIAETFHLLEEAVRSGSEIHAVLAAESASERAADVAQHVHERRIPVTVLPDALFQSISATESAQGVMALVTPRVWRFDQLVNRQALVAVLDGIQDPGNAGAIVRTAEAFGATGAIFVKGSASPHHPKTLRGSAGSLFRLPFLESVDARSVGEMLGDAGLDLFAAMPAHAGGTLPLHEADLAARCALILGSEAHGVSAELRRRARGVSIPTVGVESLNAAVAAGILLYEARRQRAERA
jgi:TrmH family RNA methyltransferase